MAVKLRLENYADNNIVQRTYLDADADKGAGTITSRNPNGYSIDGFIIVGRLGDESSQLVRITTVTGDDLGITPTLLQPHVRYEEITALLGNQIKVYRAAAPVDGSVPADSAFTVIGTAGIQSDSLTTDFTDVSGSGDYWYKFTYFNSLTNDETDLSTSLASRGTGTGRNHYATLEDIRFEAGFQRNPNISDTRIAQRRDDAENEINSTLQGLYALPFKDPVPGVIGNITRLLAAGFLLQTEFRPVVAGSNSPGDDKVKEARQMLQDVLNRKLAIVDAQMASMSTAQGVSSWPDNSTATADASDGGADRMFRVSDDY